MNKELKSHYVDEVKYQTKMLNNLKRWLGVQSFFPHYSLRSFYLDHLLSY